MIQTQTLTEREIVEAIEARLRFQNAQLFGTLYHAEGFRVYYRPLDPPYPDPRLWLCYEVTGTQILRRREDVEI